MPHLVLLDRYWRISSDDLPLPILFGLIMRLIRSVILAVSLETDIVLQEGSCNYGLISYLSVSLGLCIMLSLTAILCIRAGLIGTIADSIDRDIEVKPILIGHGSLLVIEILCACWGLAIFVNRSNTFTTCDVEMGNVVTILLGIAVVFQLLNAGALSCCCLTTYLRRVDDEKIQKMTDESMAESVWIQRINKARSMMRCVSCTVLGGTHIEDQDLETVSKLLTNLFHHDGFLDLVPGDVFVGLMLVRLEQRFLLRRQMESADTVHREQSESRISCENGVSTEDIDISSEPVPSPSFANVNDRLQNGDNVGASITPRPRAKSKKGTLWMNSSEFLEGQDRSIYSNKAKVDKRRMLPTDKEDRNMIADILHYVPYSLSTYTIFLAIMHPCTCSCRMCASFIFDACEKGNRTVHGDTCWIHEAAALHSKRKRKGKFIYANFENTLLLSPYCIFLDNEDGRDEVILSIRGSMSVEDFILDLKFDPVDATEILKQHGVDCHESVFFHGGMLQSAICMHEHIQKNGKLNEIIRREDGSNRKLVIVGHSLGAALASILTILYQSKYPNVHGMCYAPLGVTIDQVAAHEYRHCITSVVFAEDGAPSLNHTALTNLRERILDCISRARVNKNYILQSVYKDFELNQLLFEPGEVPSSHDKFVESTRKYNSSIHTRLAEDKRPQLTIAGRIIHFIIEDAPRSCSCEYPFATPYEVHQDAFLELKVSNNMIQDHQISAYYRGLVDLNYYDTWCNSVTN